MPSRNHFFALFFALLWVASTSIGAQASDPTVGWLEGGTETSDGYVLFTPMSGTETYLVDDFGRVMHTWSSDYRPGNSVYLREDGMLVRTAKRNGPPPSITAGGVGGIVQILDWDSNVIWEYSYSTADVQHHHDVALLPNGNILILAWERKTQAEAIAAGRSPAALQGPSFELWPEHIIEVEPTGLTTGNIVWRWNLWDHLIQDVDAAQANFGVIADHPELLDINARQNNAADWIHANSIDYNPELDQIMISAHHLDEIWIIDHSTTTAEAAGHTGGDRGRGGDLLYRWGNPQNYGAPGVAQLFGQHCAEWILPGRPGAGNILLFNNGVDRPGGQYSSIDELVPPVDIDGNYSLASGAAYDPSAPVWSWSAPDPFSFYASFVSGTRRLPNGNTIICNGPQGSMLEVNAAGDVVWRYRNPVGGGQPAIQGDGFSASCFRTNRYAPDYLGFAGRVLVPSLPIERYPTPGDFDADGDVDLVDFACFTDLFSGECVGVCAEPQFMNASGYYGDFDADGDIDCDDRLSFEAVYAGPANPLEIPECAEVLFVRADANGDGSVDIGDAIEALGQLFLGEFIACEIALDMNDDNTRDIGDPVYLLSALFSGGPGIPAPVGACGVDPTPGLLECNTYTCP